MKLKRFLYQVLVQCWSIMPFKFVIVRILKKLNLPEKIWTELWFENNIEVIIEDKKILLELKRGDKSTQGIFWQSISNSWDATSIKIWALLSKQSSVIADIGANIGLYAITAQAINKNAYVIAFEPSRKMYKLLETNVKLNSFPIKTYKLALSNSEGNTTFYDLDDYTAVASLKANENLKQNNSLITYNVPIKRFSSFFKEQSLQKIDLVSIDVEMNENEVLEGMGELIHQFRPSFIIEVLNDVIGNTIQSHFAELNYVFYRINEGKGMFKVDNLYQNDHQMDFKGYNYLICQQKVAEYLISECPNIFIEKN